MHCKKNAVPFEIEKQMHVLSFTYVKFIYICII